MKICGTCRQEYDDAYDKCPWCARARSWRTMIAVVVALGLLGCALVSCLANG